MLRYFFNVRYRQRVYEDREGEVLSNIAAARLGAAHDIQLFLDQDMLDGPVEEYWVEICDQGRSPVASIHFGRHERANGLDG